MSTESRMVAILRTDIVSSTELQEQAGEQVANQAIANHLRMVRRVVVGHEGEIAKELGDGVWAVFDSANRAVHAAREIQAEVARHRRNHASDPQLHVRAGVSAGEVVLRNGDPQGRFATEAQRLEEVAEPDQILCTAIVRLLTQGWFEDEIRHLGPRSLKGFSEPHEVYEIAWDDRIGREGELPARLRQAPAAPFVGRGTELDALRAGWDAARAGRPGIVLLSGEPGVGKTRLLREIATEAFDQGGTVLFGRCSGPGGPDGGSSPPYEPFGEALAHFVTHLRDRTHRLGSRVVDLIPLNPDAADFFRRVGGAESDTSEAADRELVRRAALDWITAASVDEPVLLVLDDFHRADDRSLDLLASLATDLDRQRVLVVCAHRDTVGELGDDVRAAFDEIRRSEIVRDLLLERFDASASSAMIASVAGTDAVRTEPKLVHHLWRQTGGNALFLEAVVTDLRRRGVLVDREGELRASEVDEVPVPRLVKHAVSTRLDSLDASQLEVLRAVSILGDEAAGDLVAATVTARGVELGDALPTLVADGVLVETPHDPPSFHFAHDLFREVLDAEMSPEVRTALHRSAAGVIQERRGDDLDRYAAALSHHLRRTGVPGDRDRAYRFGFRAARHAESQLAMDRAAGLYLDAASLLEGATDRRRRLGWCDAMTRSGRAARIAGDAAGRPRILGALHVAEELGAGEVVARAALACTRGMFASVGSVDGELVDALESAMALLAEEDSALRASVLATYANELAYARDRERQGRLSSEAVEMATRVGDPIALARVLNLHVNTIWWPDRLQERLDLLPELKRTTDRVGRPRLRFAAASSTFQTAMEAGDFHLADASLERMERVASQLGFPDETTAYLRLRQATRLALGGNLEGAEQAAADAYRLGLGSGQPDAELFNMGQMWMICYHRGRLHEQRKRFEGAVEFLPDHTVLRTALGALYVEEADLDLAASVARTITADDFETVDQDLLVSAACGAIIAAGTGDERLATIIHEVLVPYQDQFVDNASTNFGSVRLYLGMTAGVLGRLDEALQWFEASDRAHEAMPARPYLARASLERGRLLHRAGRPEEGRQELAAARDRAVRDGLAGAQRAAERELRRL